MNAAVPFSPELRPGDIVTRDGTDEQIVLGPVPGQEWYGITVTVRCIKAPTSGWCVVGEEESNLSSRYQLVRRRTGQAEDVSGDVSGDRPKN